MSLIYKGICMRKLKRISPTFYKYDDAEDDLPPGVTQFPVIFTAP